HESPLHIGSSDRQHQPRKAGTRTDVCDRAIKQRRSDRRVQNVTGPETRKLQRSDEPTQLPLLRERLREPASHVDTGTEERSRDNGLWFYCGLWVSHQGSLRGCISTRSARSMTGKWAHVPFRLA